MGEAAAQSDSPLTLCSQCDRCGGDSAPSEWKRGEPCSNVAVSSRHILRTTLGRGRAKEAEVSTLELATERGRLRFGHMKLSRKRPAGRALSHFDASAESAAWSAYQNNSGGFRQPAHLQPVEVNTTGKLLSVPFDGVSSRTLGNLYQTRYLSPHDVIDA